MWKQKHQRRWKQKLWLFRLVFRSKLFLTQADFYNTPIITHIFKTKLWPKFQFFGYRVYCNPIFGLQGVNFNLSTTKLQWILLFLLSCFSLRNDWLKKKLYWQQLSWIMLLINVRKCLKHFICSDILSNQLLKSDRDLRRSV